MAKGLKKITRRILKSELATSVLSYVLYLYTKLVGLTTRWKKNNLDELYKTWDENQSIILVIWHGRATMIPYFWNKKHPLNALVSLHNDGQLMARLLKHYGVGVIGGSTTANSRGAAVNLMKSLKNNTAICIIPDGPIGPSMKMTISPLYFAQKTGKPIIGAVYSVNKAKIFNKSWDEMMFPYPFGKGIVSTTKAYYIPQDAGEDDLENYRRQIEKEMIDISINADKSLHRQPVLPGTKVKTKKRPQWEEN